jgi:hypothetical protein
MPLPEKVSVLLASRPIRGGTLAPEGAAWFAVPRRTLEPHAED